MSFDYNKLVYIKPWLLVLKTCLTKMWKIWIMKIVNSVTNFISYFSIGWNNLQTILKSLLVHKREFQIFQRLILATSIKISHRAARCVSLITAFRTLIY